MAVAFDTVQSVVSTAVVTGTGATTPSLTISASATLAVAFVEMSLEGGTSDANITGTGTFTLGGNAFSHLASAKKHSGSDADTSGFVDIYYLISPPTGSQTATWAPTFTGAGGLGDWTLTVATFTGTDTSSPFGTPQLANGKLVSSLTVTDTLASGDLIAGICCNGSANPGVTTGTSIAVPTGGNATASHFTRTARNAATGSTSIVFSTNSGDWSAAAAVKILQASAAGKSIVTYSKQHRNVLLRR